MTKTIDKLKRTQPSTKSGLVALITSVAALLGYQLAPELGYAMSGAVLAVVGVVDLIRDEDMQAIKRMRK